MSGSQDAGDKPSGDGNDLERVRELLVGQTQRQLEELRRRVEDPETRAADISDVLAHAVRASTSSDERLSKALAPTIENSFQVSVKRDPRALVDAIAPIMGPAIRRSIIQTIGSMVQSMNHALEQSISPQGIRWRIEAMRSGRPFAEVVLIHTLVYRVEQVFLIHGETGLLLKHAAAPSAQMADADMVSGMLTAIQDFIHDSFGGDGDREDGVHSLRVGERTVWVESGPNAVLACVVRGEAPERLRVTLHEALETIHLEKREALHGFSGDIAPFEDVGVHLEDCVEEKFRTQDNDEEEPAPKKSLLRSHPVACSAAAIVALVAIVWGVSQGISRYEERGRWLGFREALAREPGIVVIDAGRNGDGYFVRGLRDPLSRLPGGLPAAQGLEWAVRYDWEPYLSFSPELLVRRARDVLTPPATVELQVEGQTLTGSGRAPHAWLRQAQRLESMVTGVARLDLEAVVDTDQVAWQEATMRLQSIIFRFPVGSVDLDATHASNVTSAIATIAKLRRAGLALGYDVMIDVVGHADNQGLPQANLALSRRRAQVIAAALVAGDVPPAVVRILAEGDSQQATGDDARRVELVVSNASSAEQ